MRKGQKHSEESKRKMSLAKTGQKLSEETKRNISVAQKGKKLTAEHKEKIRIAKTGWKHSEETKRNMSIFRTGKKLSEEHKRNMSISRTGKKHTEETKAKIGAIKKNKKHTKESREKISKGQIKRILENGLMNLKGSVHGVDYESSYEKAGIEFFHKRGWPVKRCTEAVPYFFGGIQRWYLPDLDICKANHWYIVEFKGWVKYVAKNEAKLKAAKEIYGKRFLYYDNQHPTMLRMLEDDPTYTGRLPRSVSKRKRKKI